MEDVSHMVRDTLGDAFEFLSAMQDDATLELKLAGPDAGRSDSIGKALSKTWLRVEITTDDGMKAYGKPSRIL